MKTLVAVLVFFFTIAFFSTVLGQDVYVDTAFQLATPGGVEHNQFYKEYLYAMTPTPPSGILVYAVPTVSSQATAAIGYLNALRPPAVRELALVPNDQSADLQLKAVSRLPEQLLLFQPESPLLPKEFLLLTKNPWRVVTIIHQNEPVAFDAIQPIYVAISPDGLSAQTTNCNRLGFGLNSTGNQQYQLGEGVMTDMLCPERQTKQYDDFYRALSPTTRFERQGEELRLIGDESEIVLEATHPFNLADPEFTQNRWQLLEITHEGQPVSFDAIRPVYLEITGDGYLHFKTEQCNFATFTMAIKSDEYYQLSGGDTSYECPQSTINQFSALFSNVRLAVSETNTLKLNGTQLLLTGAETRVVLEMENAQ